MQYRIICRLLPNLQVEVVSETPPVGKVESEKGKRFRSIVPHLEALGTCTVMTVGALAATSALSLESLVVELEAKPEAGIEETPFRVLRRVKVSGSLKESDLERIRQWAERCLLPGEVRAGVALETQVVRP